MTEAAGTRDAPLPERVRVRVVEYASRALAALPADQVPGPLRRYRDWAPARRTRLAAVPLAAAVERDAAFRQQAFACAAEAHPDLGEALRSGTPLPAADPVEVAAVAYLGRTPGWQRLVEAAQDAVAVAQSSAEVARLQQELAKAQAELAAQVDARAAQLDAARAEVAAARAEAAELAKALRAEKGARRRAERDAAAAREQAVAAVAAAESQVAEALERARRAEAQAGQARRELEVARQVVREGRTLADSRARLLLDTVVEAAQGLRRELGLPPTVERRPADTVAAAAEATGTESVPERALAPDDPALLDDLLGLPQVHLIVDGYNVTKTGFPDQPLETQRARLVNGLAALAARSGAEVTCCFDGAEVGGRVSAPSPRGVRVLFSQPGQTADELIRRLVRAEPAGRPVVVVSADREVAEGVRRHGARPVAARALVRRLDRA